MRTRLSTISRLSGQRGAAALLVVLLLMLAMAIITITTSRTNVVEEKIANNYSRALLVQQKSAGLVTYVVTWASNNKIPWAGGTQVNCLSNGCGTLNIPNEVNDNDGAAYDFAVQFSRTLPDNGYVHVVASAVQSSDNSNAAEDVWIKQSGFLSTSGSLPAPIVVNGSTTNFTGTPDIYPQWTDLNNNGARDNNEWVDANHNGTVDTGEWSDTNGNGVVDNELGVAIVSSAPAASVDTGHLNVNGGEIQTSMIFPDWDGDGKGSTWEYYFAYSQSDFKNDPSTSTTLAADGGNYWLTSDQWHANTTYGSEDNPAIIVFAPEAGCPNPRGNTTVYGIILFLSTATCNAQGWNNLTLYGSLGFEGGINKLNATPQIYGVGSGMMSAPPNINETPRQASVLPGTWKDFNVGE